MRRPDPALVVVLAGISAALHIGKLPPALPVLRDALHITLVQAGFLLSLVQVAGMTLGLAIGAAADSLGPRRTMVLGLLILSVASLLGGAASTPEALLALRALEGVGFLLGSLPAPGLIRRLVEPRRLAGMLGLWGAYMPFGTAAALLVGPAFMGVAGWPGWWWLLGVLSLIMAGVLWVAVPASADQRSSGAAAGLRGRIVRTIASPGPWLVSLAFAVYSAQWLAVIGFLPTIYAQAGLATTYAAVATALAAAVNMIGNIASGPLLQRGVPAPRLLQCGYLAMGLGAVLAFAAWGEGGGWQPALRYAGVLLFSMVGGLVPGTLFSVAVRVAPDDSTLSTTVGWMQQWSAFGQFAGPPLAAWAAARAGGWHVTWWVTGTFALAGVAITLGITRYLAGHLRGARRLRSPLPRIASMSDLESAVADTRRWLERAVVGLNLCPFAKSVLVKQQVHIVATPARDAADILEDFARELDALSELDAAVRDTTLLVIPAGMEDFLSFHDLTARAERLVRKRGLEGTIQVASFHPRFVFAGADEDDITNYTNRAPHPTLHLLREASIARAVAAFPDAAAIYETNMETLRRLGREGWDALGVGASE